jgi:type IV secretory pathway VirD2 relaxase
MTALEDFPRFRPRFGKRQKSSEPRPKSFRAAMNELVARSRGGAPARTKPERPLGPDRKWEALRPGGRRVVIKTTVVRLGRDRRRAQRSTARHLNYITRDGVGEDGSPGALYGPDGPARREDFDGIRPNERHQFRLQVSPEDGNRLNLQDYVRTLMREVERDIGRRLEWVAANHYNTAHPHAHVIVRGVGLDGQELRMTREYISRGMRWRAEEIATDTLGRRNEFEIRRTREREVTQERFTSIDRELEKRAVDDIVRPRSADGHQSHTAPSLLIARLTQLKKMTLARELASNEWELAQGWQKTLRELGEKGDIIKCIHRTVGGDLSRYHWLRAGQPLRDPYSGEVDERPLVGRVADKGLADENRGTFYVVLETAHGDAYHVPLEPKLIDSVRVGDIVGFRTERDSAVRTVDRQIADIASRHGGAVTIGSDDVNARTARAVARLRELEREGLATPQGPRAWQVPVDLLDQLEARHQAQPARYRMRVATMRLSLEEQVIQREPVWLDTLDARALSPRGFGAEVTSLLQRRHALLRELGMALPDRGPGQKPMTVGNETGLLARTAADRQERTRRDAGEDLARQTHRTFLPTIPTGFRGEVRSVGQGSSYLEVSDGSCFVLIPASREARARIGKTVDLTSDHRGRLLGFKRVDRDLGRGR